MTMPVLPRITEWERLYPEDNLESLGQREASKLLIIIM